MTEIPNALDETWTRIRAAFAHYGKTNTRSQLSPDRRKLLQKRLDDGFTHEELVKAVHGFVQVAGGLDAVWSFPDGKTCAAGEYFRPETVYKAAGFDDRVERGWKPWEPRKVVTRADERQEKWQKDFEANKRLVMEERGLRVARESS